MFKYQIQHLLLLILGLGLISCSSSQKTSSTAPSPSFDTSEYYNPYDLKAAVENQLNNPDQASGKISLDDFVPAKIKGSNIMVGVTKKVTSPKSRQFNSFSNNGNYTEVYLYIDENGVLQKIERGNTTDSNFESGLIKSLEKANYEPATLNGKPVKSVKKISFNH